MPKYTSIRVAGLFRTKRQGMYIGVIKPEQMEEMQAVMNKKLTQQNGLLLLLFKAESDNPKLRFNLLVDSAKPFEKKTRRPIEEDDEDQDNDTEEETEEEETEEVDEEEAPKKKSKKSKRNDDDDEF